MRVISKFHDYYDALMDNADSYIYNRVAYKTVLPDRLYSSKSMITNPFNKFSPEYNHKLTNDQQNYIVSLVSDVPDINRSTDSRLVVGVGGVLYTVIKNEYNGIIKLFDDSKLYDDDCVQHSKIQPVFYKNIWPWNRCDYKTIADWNSIYKTNSNNIDIFINLRTPLFVVECTCENTLIINPCLKTYALNKYFNIHTIYQDIDHFCTNVLTNIENKDTIMTDIVKRDMKGFDKYSFKKDKIIKQS
jgi:hypothetical protein